MTRTTTRGAALLAAVALALAGCTGGSGSNESPAATSSATSSPASDGGGSTYPTSGTSAQPSGGGSDQADDGCTLDASDQTIPSEAPAVNAWPDYHGTGVPVSDAFGPTERDGEVWKCFAHSPTGALFAAAYLRPAVASSEVRQAYVSDDPQTEKGNFDAPQLKLRGFAINSYDADTVTLDLVYEGNSNGQSGLIAFPMALHWENGQWMLHASEMNQAKARPVTGLTGFTQWSVAG